jgi:UDPglucose 6-dehydrogenase
VKITVYGAGYVGLVAAACFAEVGHDVLAVDPNPERLQALQQGRVPFVEAGLDALVAKGVTSGKLTFSDDPEVAAGHSTMHVLAVGTPSATDGSTDESQLISVAHAIGRGATGNVIVVIKSTAPVGAAERVIDEVRHEFSLRNVEFQAEVVVNPEFLRAGTSVKDFLEPDRVVVGGESQSAVAAVASLYTSFTSTERIFQMDLASAALVKYAANAMLATRISFMNELANLAELVGADIAEVQRGIGADPRIGGSYLQPGMGYGGSCLPKDVASLIAVGEAAGSTMGVIRAAAEANSLQAHRITEKLERHLGDLAGRTIAVWGLAFKGGTDDLRDAPSHTLIMDLVESGASVRAYDPAAGDAARRLYSEEGDVTIVTSLLAALEGADALAIAADWPEFRALPLPEIARALSERIVVDGRNLFAPKEAAAAGLTYSAVGRGDN